MSWMDSSTYLLIEGAAHDRLRSFAPRTKVQRPRPAGRRRGAVRSSLATILYMASALRTQTRGIDRYIDYFGEPVFGAR